MPRIVFRADASTAIGSGHVVRCATLAEELARRGADIRFLCRTLPGDYGDWLEARGFAVTRLHGTTVDEDIAQSREALGETPPDWLVVDHYGLDARWEEALRPQAANLMVIDDQTGRQHSCDLLLDQNYAPGAAATYAALLLPGAESLLGPRYALLRPEFATARAQLRPRNDQVRRVLVCFGGSDPQGHTLATLQALQPYLGYLERIDVVVGPANLAAETITAACRDEPRIQVHCPANDLAALLGEADLAIGAGGTMNWERACLGVPTLAFGIADNQRKILEALLADGHLLGAAEMAQPDPARIAGWLAAVLDNPALLRGIAERSASLVDGLGTRRVADHLFPPTLTFRPAVLADSDDLLRWRNDPVIRTVSLDPREIDASTHATWLEHTLSNPQRLLLIAESADGRPLGVVRFDLAQPEALISVYRIPGESCRGLILQATGWLRRKHPEIRRVVAEIRPDNLASLAAFRAAGYRGTKNTFICELEPS